MVSEAIFQFKNVDLHMGPKHILKDLTLDVKRGEFLAILGASGAGKSSLLRLFNLLNSPTSGEIKFRGQDPNADIHTLRCNVGFMFQNPAIFNGSVRENLTIAGRWDTRIQQLLDHEILDILKQVELQGIELNQPARDLSGGEQQRLALARTLLNHPQVLLLDEPTSNLDPKLALTIMQLIKKLQQELDLSVIAVSHDHRLMRQIADRVILLKQGGIVRMGSFPELEQAGLFETFLDSDLKEGKHV